METFQERILFDDRVKLSSEIMQRYPDRIPIICQPKQGSEMTIDKVKFLAPKDFKMGHFMVTLRNRVSQIRSSDAIYVFCKNVCAPSNETLGDIYQKYKDEDGLLYFEFDKESTFG